MKENIVYGVLIILLILVALLSTRVMIDHNELNDLREDVVQMNDSTTDFKYRQMELNINNLELWENQLTINSYIR